MFLSKLSESPSNFLRDDFCACFNEKFGSDWAAKVEENVVLVEIRAKSKRVDSEEINTITINVLSNIAPITVYAHDDHAEHIKIFGFRNQNSMGSLRCKDDSQQNVHSLKNDLLSLLSLLAHPLICETKVKKQFFDLCKQYQEDAFEIVKNIVFDFSSNEKGPQGSLLTFLFTYKRNNFLKELLNAESIFEAATRNIMSNSKLISMALQWEDREFLIYLIEKLKDQFNISTHSILTIQDEKLLALLFQKCSSDSFEDIANEIYGIFINNKKCFGLLFQDNVFRRIPLYSKNTMLEKMAITFITFADEIQHEAAHFYAAMQRIRESIAPLSPSNTSPYFPDPLPRDLNHFVPVKHLYHLTEIKEPRDKLLVEIFIKIDEKFINWHLCIPYLKLLNDELERYYQLTQQQSFPKLDPEEYNFFKFYDDHVYPVSTRGGEYKGIKKHRALLAVISAYLRKSGFEKEILKLHGFMPKDLALEIFGSNLTIEPDFDTYIFHGRLAHLIHIFLIYCFFNTKEFQDLQLLYGISVTPVEFMKELFQLNSRVGRQPFTQGTWEYLFDSAFSFKFLNFSQYDFRTAQLLTRFIMTHGSEIECDLLKNYLLDVHLKAIKKFYNWLVTIPGYGKFSPDQITDIFKYKNIFFVNPLAKTFFEQEKKKAGKKQEKIAFQAPGFFASVKKIPVDPNFVPHDLELWGEKKLEPAMSNFPFSSIKFGGI